MSSPGVDYPRQGRTQPITLLAPMHLAFVGLCPESSELAVASAAMGHRITWFVSAEQRPHVVALFGAAPIDLQPQQEWEALANGGGIAGIVLAEASEQERELRTEQWRRLTQAGARILFVHPIVPDLLVYLEVDMLARESGARLLPYWRDVHSGSAAELRNVTAAGDWREGHLEQVTFRRLLSDRSPRAVTRWFARDAVLLEYLAGPFDAITAVGARASEAAYANLEVHLHGAAEVPVRWEVARAAGQEQGILSWAGRLADRTLLFDEPATPRIAEWDAAGECAEGGEGPPPRAALAGIEAFQDIGQDPSPPLQDWHRAVRAMELADSIEISLRRGRRIEVHYRQMTEETSYKGMMSAAGCGLLMLGLAILVFAGMLNAVFGWRLTRFWYVPVLVLFVAFLALQIMARLLVRRGDRGSSTRRPQSS